MKKDVLREEADLLTLFRRDKNDARTRLYSRYARYLAGVAYRYLPNNDMMKDVLQESFIKIFTNIDRFEYRGEGSLRGWMAHIVMVESVRVLNMEKRHGELFLRIDDEDIDVIEEDTPDINDISTDILLSMIHSLPDDYRTVFNLCVVDGMSHKEVAKLLGIRENTSASKLFRAKKLLSKMIMDYNNK